MAFHIGLMMRFLSCGLPFGVGIGNLRRHTSTSKNNLAAHPRIHAPNIANTWFLGSNYLDDLPPGMLTRGSSFDSKADNVNMSLK